jgi:hypothetical protein
MAQINQTILGFCNNEKLEIAKTKHLSHFITIIDRSFTAMPCARGHIAQNDRTKVNRLPAEELINQMVRIQ